MDLPREDDVPLVQAPNEGGCNWYNWFGGKPKEYDIAFLKPGNNWEAESFQEWQKIVKNSV